MIYNLLNSRTENISCLTINFCNPIFFEIENKNCVPDFVYFVKKKKIKIKKLQSDNYLIISDYQ